METEQKFRTKTGYCHILEDKIVFTREGIIGDLSKITVGNNITRILIIYGAIALLWIYFAYDSYTNGERFFAYMFGLIAALLILGIFRSLNYSATPIIERSKIKNIKLRHGFKGLTRSRFEIEFESNSGKTKKRLVMLPGSLSNGEQETAKAVRVLREENLLKNIL